MRILRAAMLAACFGLLNGCIAFYSRHDVHVIVKDAETQAPIAGCEIVEHPVYYLFRPINLPPIVDVHADALGEATVHSTTLEPQEWKFDAPSYIGIHEIVDDPLASPTILLMYREPIPTVTILVPNGYRGPVAVELDSASTFMQETAGQRSFKFHIKSNGYVRIRASLMLMRMDEWNIRARYENGQAVAEPSGCNDTEPKFRLALANMFSSGQAFHNSALLSQHEDRGLKRRILFCIGSKTDTETLDRSTVCSVPGHEYEYALTPAFDRLFADPAVTQSASRP